MAVVATAKMAPMAAMANMPPTTSITTAPSFDVLLTGGRVVDGAGNPWFVADVGITAGKIAAVGRLSSAHAKTRIDATGKVVAPGFIDAHVHGDLAPLMDPQQEAAI